MPNYTQNYDQDSYARMMRDYGFRNGDCQVSVRGPSHGIEYEHALREAFAFMRRHDDGRYSSRMKMRILNAAERAEERRLNGQDPDTAAPGVVKIEVPFAFDEETEVKSGGALGILVVWPEDSGRVMLAVHKDHRRKKVGSALMGLGTYPVGVEQYTAWVNQRNTVAQHFLLSRGFMATGLNQVGGVCWTYGGGTVVDGVEDDPFR